MLRRVRILHISDIHNNLNAARFAMRFSEDSSCDVVVDTGDISGIGGWWERFFLSLVPKPSCQLVFAPGNHDGKVTIETMKRRGAHVLDGTQLIDIAGLRFWGYPDPNRTKLFGKPYDPAECVTAASRTPVPEGVDVIAVHNHLMVPRAVPRTSLVLSGHLHKTAVDSAAPPAWIRQGQLAKVGRLAGCSKAC